jgi:plastocyanin
MSRYPLSLLAVLPMLLTPALAAPVSVALTDSHGAPAANAVVTLTPAGNADLAPRAPDEAIIDQRNQTFLPLVVIVRRGGHVVFTNNDNTMHQVYSFSPIKQFEFEIRKGERSKPIVFDKAGVAAIGCNIHDNMIAYVFATDAPVAVLTDAKGTAQIDAPAGVYHAAIWHPRFMVGQAQPAFDITVTANGATISRSLSLMADKMSNMHSKHMQSY